MEDLFRPETPGAGYKDPDQPAQIVEPDDETGRLADGFPRSSGSNASRIFELAAALAEETVVAAPMHQRSGV